MIHKIAGIILKDRKFLAVKEYEMDILLMPGGRVEENEKPEETLRRELKEEMDVNLISMKPFGTFTDRTHDNKDDLILETYFAEIQGNPTPNSEIEKFFWVDSKFTDPQVSLSIPLKKYIIPKLLEMNLIE